MASYSAITLLLFVMAAWLSSHPFFVSVSPVVQGPFLFEDPAGSLQPEEALRHALEHDSTDAIGIATRSYWWVAEVENPTDAADWVLHLGNPSIEWAQLFVFAEDGLIHQDAVDLLATARSGKGDYTIGHHFPLPLPPGARRSVVLQLKTDVTHKGLIFLKPAAVAQAESHFHMLAIWTAAGAVAALIFYNLFLGLSLREINYLYYVGHASGHLIYLLTALGLLGATLPILERYLLLNIPGIGIGVLFGALFVYHFLQLPSLSPRLARLYQIFIGVMLLSPLLIWVMDLHTFISLVRGSHLVLALLVISAALIGMSRNKREARYILVGWGGMVAMTSKGMLGVLGVVELTIDAGIWALWAILFEMFFLSLALADRVRRLSREKDAAQAANAAKSTFLANMSHEIRTPLNGVMGMVDILRGTRLDAKQRDYLEHISQCGKALLSLLDDILDYSRVEAGRIRLERTNFDLRQLLDQLVFLLAPQAEKKGLRLGLAIDPDVPALLTGDPGRLRQVLMNLLGNALKFTERGTVQLKVESLRQDGNDHRLRFQVIDTGIGMEAEAIENLFERFQQADSSIARRYGGSGLGLAIVRELVALMGGRIRVESQPGRGSCIEIELTLATGQPLPEEAGAADDIRLPTLSILVVDDDDINRLVATTLLAREGHHVAAVDSGHAALARIGEESFDVVLMDLGMPEMDGLEATRRLRAAGVRIPVIGLTAHVLPEQNAACIAAGMNTVIHKPVQIDIMKRLLARVIETNDAGLPSSPATSPS